MDNGLGIATTLTRAEAERIIIALYSAPVPTGARMCGVLWKGSPLCSPRRPFIASR
jgi:hypothetical protein